jgi:hypothetical protein
MNDHHSFKFSSGIYYQSPSYVWVINPFNKNLKALKNMMQVVGWDYLVKEDLRFSIEGYYKDYKNLPTGILENITDHIVITNTGTNYGGREEEFQSFGFFDLLSKASGNSYGIELLMQKKFSDIPCYGQVSLSYSKSMVTASNKKTYPGRYDQRIIFNLSGGYIFNAKWEISAKFRYFTGTPYTPVYRPSENPIQPGYIQNIPAEYLMTRLGNGHHLDLRVDRYFTLRNWTLILFADIQNVYNNKIPIPPRYDFWEDKIENTNRIALFPSIGFSVEF